MTEDVTGEDGPKRCLEHGGTDAIRDCDLCVGGKQVVTAAKDMSAEALGAGAVGEEVVAEPTPEMRVNALAKFFGANVRYARLPGELLAAMRCGTNVVGCMGGCSELPYFTGRQKVANDVHRHIVNLARTLADRELKDEVAEWLDGLIYHPDVLRASQRFCVEAEARIARATPEEMRRIEEPDPVWAGHYLVTTWMGRGGCAGKRGEFSGVPSVRWDSAGGGSNKRFRSMVASLDGMQHFLKDWEFTCLHYRALLEKMHDDEDTGGHFDPPWWDKGKDYKHPFTREDHADLADRLAAFKKARIIVRYGDCPAVRELYPANKGWRYTELVTKNQRNNKVCELLITNFDVDGRQMLIDEAEPSSAADHKQLPDSENAPEGSDGTASDQEG